MTSAMFCSKCGAQLVPGAAFCSTCGSAVASPPTPAQPVPPPPPTLHPRLIPPDPAQSPSSAPPTLFATPSAASAAFVIKRPVIVTVLAVLQFIGATFWVLVGAGSLAANTTGPEMGAALFVATLFIAIGIAQVFCGLGLLRLRPYGRTIQLAFAWIGLLAIPVGTIISVLILLYFFKPGIKLIFAGRPGDDFTDQELAEINNDTATSPGMVAVIAVVGVLLIIMIVGIVAAISVPALLRARTAGNEASAMASLRAINQAQIHYSASCAQGGFAVSLEDLARPPAGTNAPFVSADLARNDIEKSGYIFNVTRDQSPIASDVGTAAATCNGSSGQPASSYFATAEPVNPGSTGTRYFAIDDRGVLYESTHPISNPIMNSTSVVPVLR